MKIVKLPADYVRYLNEGKHVVFNNYEYWVFLKGGNIEEVKIV